jgi:TonB family protein
VSWVSGTRKENWRRYSRVARLLFFTAVSGCLLGRAPELRAEAAVSLPAAPLSDVIAPVLLAHPPIEYPAELTGSASVQVTIEISADGRVLDVTANEPESPFAPYALHAARAWSFVPARRGGTAISAKLRVEIRFEAPLRSSDSRPGADSEPSSGTTAGADTAGVPVPKALEPEERGVEITVYGVVPELQTSLSMAEVRALPGAFGDPFRAVEVLPGVTPLVSGLPYFYVRGAPPGNVGYVFDGIAVPLLYHAGAGPGVIEPSLIESVELYPGAYPASLGRFAGGVVSGTLAEPAQEFRARATLRLVDAGGMLGVPFAGGRGHLTLAGRYSYTAAVISLVAPDVSLSYWDYQSRIRYQLDAANRLEILAFGAKDYLGQVVSGEDRAVVDVGFHRYDVRWDHTFGGSSQPGNLRTAFTLGLDRAGADNGNIDMVNTSGRLRTEFSQHVHRSVTLRAGVDARLDFLKSQSAGRASTSGDFAIPGSALNSDLADGQFTTVGTSKRRDDVVGVYVEAEVQATRRITVTPGARVDVFHSEGRVKVGVDPRLSARILVLRGTTINYGIGIAHQPPSFFAILPGVKPRLGGGLQTAVQNSAGLEHQSDTGIQASATLFHNVFLNLSDPLSTSRLDDNLQQPGEGQKRTQGRSFGVELAVRRNMSVNLSGVLSYTLSRSERSVYRVHGPALFDRTHVLNLALSYDLGSGWRLGGRGLLYSGLPALVAYPKAAENPPRSKPFWRIDWRAEKRWQLTNSTSVSVIAEVLNTTLNKEVLEESCNAYVCRSEGIGPVTIPSLGAEAIF